MATYVDIDTLPAATLRHLAALRDDRDQARYIDYEVAATELAEMLSDGRTPTIGWYRRRLRSPVVAYQRSIAGPRRHKGIPD